MNQLLLNGLSRATADDGLNVPTPRQGGLPGHAGRRLPVGISELCLATRSRPRVETALPVLADEYVCPGETHPISHSIHLARLASHFSTCRECQHRHNVGHLALPSTSTAGQPAAAAGATVQRAARTSLLETDGVRGVYLNEIDRTRAAEWGAALASMLWDDEPRVGAAGEHGDQGAGKPGGKETRRQGELNHGSSNDACPSSLFAPQSPSVVSSSRSTRRGPAVVIGFDERPASPDIVTGVALGLRRMGCQVIDLGQTTAACFQFAVRHLDATAGLFVTGSGCDPAWTGFDVVGRGAGPWSTGQKLEELEARARSGVMRPTRAAGTQRTFQALVPYEAGLWKHFHALRPLHVVCGSATKLFPRLVDRIFARLPCRVTHVTLPVRRRDVCDEQDSDVRRIATAVVSGGQDLGLIVDDDGQHCAFVTERGGLVSPGELARLLIGFERHEHHCLKVVATQALAGELTPWLMRLGVNVATSEDSAASVTAALAQNEARLGMLGDGRVWFGETPPACDAIVTLARVLQALSLSDASCAEVISAGR